MWWPKRHYLDGVFSCEVKGLFNGVLGETTLTTGWQPAAQRNTLRCSWEIVNVEVIEQTLVAQVDADPSSRKRVALRSEQDIARITGRSNIVSKASIWPPLLSFTISLSPALMLSLSREISAAALEDGDIECHQECQQRTHCVTALPLLGTAFLVKQPR